MERSAVDCRVEALREEVDYAADAEGGVHEVEVNLPIEIVLHDSKDGSI